MSVDDGSSAADAADLDCAVCLQPSVHPVRLPCGHLFCYLCVKGIAFLGGKCAMCRRDIPRSCLDDPDLVRRDDPALLPVAQHGVDHSEEEDDVDEEEAQQKWFYQGRNGACYDRSFSPLSGFHSSRIFRSIDQVDQKRIFQHNPYIAEKE
jgi:E3 ubiquitin-protein ligase RNF146